MPLGKAILSAFHWLVEMKKDSWKVAFDKRTGIGTVDTCRAQGGSAKLGWQGLFVCAISIQSEMNTVLTRRTPIWDIHSIFLRGTRIYTLKYEKLS